MLWICFFFHSNNMLVVCQAKHWFLKTIECKKQFIWYESHIWFVALNFSSKSQHKMDRSPLHVRWNRRHTQSSSWYQQKHRNRCSECMSERERCVQCRHTNGEGTRWRRNRIKSTHSIYRTLYECTNTSTASETRCVHDRSEHKERETGINAFHSNSAQSLWLMIRLSSATDHTAVSVWLCACVTVRVRCACVWMQFHFACDTHIISV